ncbi:MAG: glycosyl hydrolase family 18 protein [Parafilimonas sp.]
MKNIYRLSILMVIVIAASCKKNVDTSTQSTPPNTAVIKAPADIRVVGYLISDEIADGTAASFNTSRINYLNITFTPDADGAFPVINNLDNIITAAHNNNTKVLISMGNGTPSSFIDTDTTAFINNLMNAIDEHNLDGIDVDLEGSHVDKYYQPFIASLSTALKAKGKLLTAAIATWESGRFTDGVLGYFDFFNVMSYDNTGPWDPGDPGPHSPYSMAVDDLDYWNNTRGIPKEKLNVGLPFYGYGFGKGVKVNYTYAEIVSEFPGAENVDSITVKQGGTIYYNGIPTIEKKCRLAQTSAGGVMIWELMQDANNDKSLLTTIDKTLGGK